MNRRQAILIGCAALTAFLLSWWISEAVFHRAPITTDEQSYQLQAHLFAQGKIKYPPPPFIEPFRYGMVIVDKDVGWLSRYPPGHGLWMMFGVWLNNTYFMVALAAALGVLLTARAAQRIGASVPAVILLLLLSPFYVFMYGTTMSHVSGYLAAAGLLLAYILWQQREQPAWALVAGLCWAWLFLNRTYTAFLMAIPFAVDALWYLWTRRNARAFWGTAFFAGAACFGIFVILIYNWVAVGNPLKMTYLFYDPTDKLGFGLRHHWPVFPAPQPVEHTLAKGLSDLKGNVLLLDQWIFGFRGGLLVWLALALVGWSKRWSLLFISSAVAVALGYVLFWYPGFNETGPNYYFEVYPALVLSAALGVAALWRRFEARRRVLIPVAAAAVLLWAVLAYPFVMEQARYLQGETRLRSKAINTLLNAPEKSLIFVQRRVVELAWPNHDLVFSPTGIEGGVVVARWIEASNRAVSRYFGEYEAVKLEKTEDGFYLSPMEKDPPFDLTIPINSLHRVTGTNEWDADDPRMMIRVARPGDVAERLLFGRFYYLYPGRFVVEFDVRASEEGAATLDIALSETESVFLSKPAPVSEEWQTVRFEFERDDFVIIEPRVFYHGTGEVQISRLRIAEFTDGGGED